MSLETSSVYATLLWDMKQFHYAGKSHVLCSTREHSGSSHIVDIHTDMQAYTRRCQDDTSQLRWNLITWYVANTRVELTQSEKAEIVPGGKRNRLVGTWVVHPRWNVKLSYSFVVQERVKGTLMSSCWNDCHCWRPRVTNEWSISNGLSLALTRYWPSVDGLLEGWLRKQLVLARCWASAVEHWASIQPTTSIYLKSNINEKLASQHEMDMCS